MKIYETAVRKPISVALIFVGVIFFGLYSLTKLGIDHYPEIDAPYISVITTYAGGNAEDIETNITRVLEDQLNSVDNLEKITSKSSDNVSMITLEFEYGGKRRARCGEPLAVVPPRQRRLPDRNEVLVVDDAYYDALGNCR